MQSISSLKIFFFASSGYKKNTGFTLLELMLVIFILGILTTLGLSFYQKQSLAGKINKTSSQIQQILEAARSYYIDNKCWPNSSGNLNCEQCDSGVPSFTQYLPTGISNNPFGSDPGHNYTYTPEPQFCKKFQVSSGALPSNAIALQLTNTLPNSTVTQNAPNQVLAEIALPSMQATPTPNYLIKFIGISSLLSDSQPSSFAFKCPLGWKSAGFVMFYIISANSYKGIPFLCKGLGYATGPGSSVISSLITHSVGSTDLSASSVPCSGTNPSICSYQLAFISRKISSKCTIETTTGGKVQFVEMGYCINPQIENKAALKPPMTF